MVKGTACQHKIEQDYGPNQQALRDGTKFSICWLSYLNNVS